MDLTPVTAPDNVTVSEDAADDADMTPVTAPDNVMVSEVADDPAKAAVTASVTVMVSADDLI